MKRQITIILLLLPSISFLPSLRGEHPVSFEKELFITEPIIITSKESLPGGSWHLREALARVAGPGSNLDEYADKWFTTWSENETLPGIKDKFSKRTWVTDQLRRAWHANDFHLIAIVNRIDLARFPGGDPQKPPLTLGEGRFVYEVRDGETRLPFTIIFEYQVPFTKEVGTLESLKLWAKRWHEIGRPNIDKNTYLAELRSLTDEFSQNGTLNQIRTNEFLTPPTGGRTWEMREFHHRISPASLVQVPVALTPPMTFASIPESAQLENFISGEMPSLIGGKHDSLIREFQGATSLVPNPSFAWRPGVNNAEDLNRAKFIFSFNTCSGCHAGDTDTFFQHIGVNTGSGLSPFLTGQITLDAPLPPAENVSKLHNERDIRIKVLSMLSTESALAASAQEELTGLIQGRANRTH